MIVHEEIDCLITRVVSSEELLEAATFLLADHQIQEQDPDVRRLLITYDDTVLNELADIRSLLDELPISIVLVHNPIGSGLRMGDLYEIPFIHDEDDNRFSGIRGVRLWCRRAQQNPRRRE